MYALAATVTPLEETALNSDMEILPVAELRQDHETLRRDLSAIEGALEIVCHQPTSCPVDYAALSADLSRFTETLEQHFQREEGGIFEEAFRSLDPEMPEAEILRRFLCDETMDDMHAHGKLRSSLRDILGLLVELERAAEPEHEPLRKQFGLFRTVLELHAAKEDDLIFPMLESALSPEGAAAREQLALTEEEAP